MTRNAPYATAPPSHNHHQAGPSVKRISGNVRSRPRGIRRMAPAIAPTLLRHDSDCDSPSPAASRRSSSASSAALLAIKRMTSTTPITAWIMWAGCAHRGLGSNDCPARRGMRDRRSA